MNYFETLEKVWKFIKPLSKYHQSFHFAYWIVPVAVGFCWYTTIETQDLRNSITVIPLSSCINQSKQVTSKKGFLLITNDLRDECKIPLKENTMTSQIWTSLEDSILQLNDDRIAISEQGNILKLNMPLYGENRVVGMVFEGEPKGELSMLGKSIFLNKLFPLSTLSISLVLSVFCVIAFGFGLILSGFSENY